MDTALATNESVTADERPGCRHHWIIDEARGPRSDGRCKRCGSTRQFKNWLEDSDFITNEEHRVNAA